MLLYSDLIGRKFRFNGRGPHFDCVGLMIEIHRRLGNKIVDPLDVYRAGQEVTEEALKLCSEQFEECNRPYKEGDVFLMISGRHGEHIDHVATYVGQGRCIQTTAEIGIITSEVSRVERDTVRTLRYAANHNR